MPKSLVAVVSVLVAATIVSAASAKIVVQRGIAGARIGMTQKQVRAVLGKPTKAFQGEERVRDLRRVPLPKARARLPGPRPAQQHLHYAAE